MTAAENSSQNSFVLLQIGNRRFGLAAEIITELSPPVRLHSFPHTSPLVAGVIVRRGHIVPVYDVGQVLRSGNTVSHRFYLIARRKFGEAWELSAIPVNGECELAMAELRDPEGERPKYISGMITVGEESIDVLDFESLVTSAPPNEIEAGNTESQS